MTTRKPHAAGLETGTNVEHVTPADGNVFLDIGFPPAQAERLRLHADLSITIAGIVRSRRLTRARAAALFGVTQARVIELLRGKHELFTIDALVEMLASAGYRVRLTVETPAPSQTRTGAPSRTRPSTSRPAKTRPARTRPARAR